MNRPIRRMVAPFLLPALEDGAHVAPVADVHFDGFGEGVGDPFGRVGGGGFVPWPFNELPGYEANQDEVHQYYHRLRKAVSECIYTY